MNVFKLLNKEDIREKNITSFFEKYNKIWVLIPLHSYIRDEMITFIILYVNINTLKNIPKKNRFSFVISKLYKEAKKIDLPVDELSNMQWLYKYYKKEEANFSYPDDLKKDFGDSIRTLTKGVELETKQRMNKQGLYRITSEFLEILIRKRLFLLRNM